MVSMKGLEVDLSGLRAVPLRSNSPRGDESKAALPVGQFQELQDSDEDEVLLDWQQYSNSRFRFCGLDFSWLIERLPFNPFVPPEWWYRLSRKNRKIFGSLFIGATFLLVFGSIIAIPLSITEHQDRKSEHDLAPAPELPHWSSPDTCAWTDFYLPRDSVTPLSYGIGLNVTLQPPYVIRGHVRIQVDVLAATRCIVLNAASMNISQVHANFGKQQQGAVVFNRVNQTATLSFKSALPRGQGYLSMEFAYILEDGLNGFYRSSYQDGGATKEIAVTMFESVYAHRAFPCFDEPEYKAVFNISLTVPSKLTALSNMPVARKTKSGQALTTWQFESTPPMSPYLVAFAVGQLAAQKGSCSLMSGSIDIGVWGTPPRAQQLKTAVKMACASLIAYEQLLQVPFPLPKLDLLGVPDFGAGAMENWGLIMYKERALLVDPEADSTITESNVAITVAHEIAHHWFGDLVTCNNWTELWLNEGFATYFEDIGSDAFQSNFSNMDRFYTDVVAVALNYDAQPSSHPLSVEDRLTQLSDADNFFDNIMYEKGGSVLRMLRAWMNRHTLTYRGTSRLLRVTDRKLAESYSETNEDAGGVVQQHRLRGLQGLADANANDTFMLGLQAYLTRYQYKTTGYADLWNTMGERTGLPVMDWMKTWTLQNGHPLLIVDYDAAGSAVTIRQLPFAQANQSLVEGMIACDDKKPLGSWWIPLSYMFEGDTTFKWSNFSSCSFSIPLENNGFNLSTKYILLNPGRYGFYRVNYPLSMWEALSEAAVDPRNISQTDLAGLLDDSFRLAEIGQLSITVFLDLTRAIGKRLQAPEYSVWHTATILFLKLSHLLAGSSSDPSNQGCFRLMSKYITSKLTGPLLHSYQPASLTAPLGIDFTVQLGESLELRLLRQEVLKLAGLYGDQQYSNTAWTLLQSSGSSEGGTVHADVREVVYTLAVETGVPEAWDTVLELYKQAKNADEKYRLLKALTAANSPDIIQKGLALMSDSDGVEAADIGRFMRMLGKHSEQSFNMTWEFFFQHFDRLVERSGDNAAYALGQSSMDLASLFSDMQQWPRLEAFAQRWTDVLPAQFLEAARENIQQNMAWLQVHRKAACDWFSKNAS